MKIIIGTPDKPLFLAPDSSLTPANMPVFVPPGPWHYQLEAVAAFRVGRLGKSIKPQFAPRYIDAYTMGFRLRCAQASPLEASLLEMADYALTLGSWMEPPVHPHMLSHYDTALQQIVRVSQFMTLRTGDILIIPAGLPQQLQPLVELKIGQDTVLRKKIIY